MHGNRKKSKFYFMWKSVKSEMMYFSSYDIINWTFNLMVGTFFIIYGLDDPVAMLTISF